MQQKLYLLLINHLKANNILTIDDLYEIADDNELELFSLYREIIELIKKEKIKKLIIENQYNSMKIIESKTLSSEYCFILNEDIGKNSLLTQSDINDILNAIH